MNAHAYPDTLEFVTSLPTGEDVVQTLTNIHAINVSPAPYGVEMEFICEEYTTRINGQDIPSSDPTHTVYIRGEWNDRLTYRIQHGIPRRPRVTGTYEQLVADLLGLSIRARGPRPKTEEEIRAMGFTRGPRPIA